MKVRRLLGQTAIIISEYEAPDATKNCLQFTTLDGTSDRCNIAAVDLLKLFEAAAKFSNVETSGDPDDGLANDQDPPEAGEERQ